MLKKTPFLLTFLFINSAYSQESDSVFVLGEVEVTATREEVGEVPRQVGSRIDSKEIRKRNRTDVADALNLVSGTSLSINQRNEKTITVRGFDSRQVPLFIDGIPVYVPYDGYVDLGRFTTADLSSIQVAKGFSSVTYGANTLGGAINLVSRKPKKKFEGDIVAGVASGNERRTSINLGSNQKTWYVQTGVSRIKSDFFPLSKKFRSTPTENGGPRNNSYRSDDKISAKIGLTPKGNDEYALSFYRQLGVKGQPPSTDPARARYWQWPYWNKQSLYYVSQTAISNFEQLKVRLYQDQFDNKINTFTDDTYTVLRTNGAGSVATGQSIYHDRSIGGSISLNTFRIPDHEMTFNYQSKTDQHREFDANDLKMALFEDTISTFAFEDSLSLKNHAVLTIGVARHELRPVSVYSKNNSYSKPWVQHAEDIQGGAFVGDEKQLQIYGTIARKSRMPTLRDRYSQRLSTFIENPELEPERALNLELGLRKKMETGDQIETAIFDSEINQKIQAVANVQGVKSQMQNIGKVRIYGAEVGWKSSVERKINYSLNYGHTFTKTLDQKGTRITDVPRHKFLAGLGYSINDPTNLGFFLEYNSRRWVSDTKEIPGFTVLNFKLTRVLLSRMKFEAGINNLSDRNYELAQGFPAPGRMYFSNLILDF